MSRTYRKAIRTRPSGRYLQIRRNPDTGKTVALVALIGAIGYGIYKWVIPEGIEEGIPNSLTITKYKNIRTSDEATSGFLDVKNGDMVRVSFEYGYVGPALSGLYYVSLWQRSPLDPHDEVGPHSEPFDIPAYPELIKIEDSIDMEIKAGMGEYGLFMQIKGIPGPDVPDPPTYLANRIRVTDGIPAEWVLLDEKEIIITPIPTEWILLDEKMITIEPVLVPAEWVLLDEKTVTIEPVIVGEWALLDEKIVTITPIITGEFILDVRSDPIWGGTVSKEPDKDLYAYGEIVTLTAHPVPGRTFDYWYLKETGEWLDYRNPINFTVLADHTIVAKF